MILTAIALLSFIISFAAVALVIRFLNKRAILDMPNERSSHDTPVPRGGGLALLPLVLLGTIAAVTVHKVDWPAPNSWWAVIAGMLVLGIVSWIDDRRDKGLPASLRFLVQLIAVALPLFFWPLDTGKILPEFIPVIVERVLIALAWVWFVNLYNFMDGINGIAGVETASIGIGVAIIGSVAAIPGLGFIGAVLFGAACGFLFWNLRKRAVIFLGDVGSITLGYVLAWLLVLIAAKGHLLAALLLPLVYLADATYTLVKRALQGKPVWQAHREHFYQQATGPSGLTHKQASLSILCVNACLIFLAVCAVNSPEHATMNMVFAAIIVVMLLRFFAGAAKGNETHSHR